MSALEVSYNIGDGLGTTNKGPRQSITRSSVTRKGPTNASGRVD